MEGQLRAQDCCSSDIALDQSLIRPGRGYALTDQSTVWMGYARVTNYLDGQGGDREKQIDIDETVCDASRLMAEKRIRHLAVTEGNKVVGLLSLRDLVKIVSVRDMPRIFRST